MLLVGTPLPALMLLDDANDLIMLKMHMGLAIGPAKWGVPEAIMARDSRKNQRLPT